MKNYFDQNLLFRGLVVATLIIFVAIIMFCTPMTIENQAEKIDATNILDILYSHINFEPAKLEGTAENSFGFSQFISSLALVVVVFNVSDFRYRYRLSLTRYDARKIAIFAAALIAIFLILTEIWFHNKLLIPTFLNNYGNLKISLATVFLMLVVYIVYICFIKSPSIGRANCIQFFSSTSRYIHQGNKDRLQAIAEEIGRSLKRIFELAEKSRQQPVSAIPLEQQCAHDLLLVLADRRFCDVVVDKNPSFAIQSFMLADINRNVPFAQFSRNIGEAFIVNTQSAFYQEDAGFKSGYFGYTKPITKIVFGSYNLIERCASEGACVLDLNYSIVGELDSVQMDGFRRAGIAFFSAYINQSRAAVHSYALARLMGALQSCGADLNKISQLSADAWRSPEYIRFAGAARFVKEAIEILANADISTKCIRPHRNSDRDVYDELAQLIIDLIFQSTSVNSDSMFCWNVQHNTAWDMQFSYSDKPAWKIIRFKVRRLIYDEIVQNYRNFKGASYLGFCLHVLGLSAGNRKESFGRRDYALRVCAISWARRHYKTLFINHPKVAEACLQGSVIYDEQGHKLVKAFRNETGKNRPVETLDLD